MKKNILYVFGGEKAQGAEIVIERLMRFNTDQVNAHLFIAPGYFAHGLVQANKPYKITLVERLKKLNRSSTGSLKFYTTALKNYFSISIQAYKYIRAKEIDIVHANTIVPSSYLIPLILYSKIFSPKLKFIWSDHDLSYYSRLDNWFSKLCVLLYDRTLVVSKAVKEKYKENDKVIVLYNGLDTTQFINNAEAGLTFRSAHKIEKDAVVIGMAAVIVPRKGQLELLEAFKNLSAHHTNIILLLAGRYGEDDPGYIAKVKAAIEANNKVLHIGYVEDMISFYNACDVVVSNTSNAGSEPLGTSIYEAMACEKIVVASDTGGTKEIVTDEVDGFLFEPGNIEKLSATLNNVVDNYRQLVPIRSAARAKVMRTFNVEEMKFQYNRVIANLIQE